MSTSGSSSSKKILFAVVVIALLVTAASYWYYRDAINSWNNLVTPQSEEIEQDSGEVLEQVDLNLNELPQEEEYALDEPFPVEELTIQTTEGESYEYTVEVARTDKQQKRGMMFRKELPEFHGMLFPFEQEMIRGFWMKNVLIPLDVLFIDKAGIIVAIQHNAQPGNETSFGPAVPVTAGLELPAGDARRLGIKEGSIVVHPHFDTE